MVCTGKHNVSNCEWLKIVDNIRSLEKDQQIIVKASCPYLTDVIDGQHVFPRGTIRWEKVYKILQTMDDNCVISRNDPKS